MFHPWGKLRSLADVIIIWASPAPGIPAATDGECRIWLDPRMSQRERRCALTHELAHMELGHHGCQPPAVERQVREAAARDLVSWEDLQSEIPWAMSLAELADDLWVTELVLQDRLRALSTAEVATLRQLCRQH